MRDTPVESAGQITNLGLRRIRSFFDGVYEVDPVTHPGAKLFDSLSYLDVLSKGLRVMDATAVSLCMENSLPIIVFNLNGKDNIQKILRGESVGTIVSQGR